MTPKREHRPTFAGSSGARVTGGSDSNSVADHVRLVDVTVGELRQIIQAALSAARPEAPASSPKLVSKVKLAEVLDVSAATVDRLVRAGRIPFVRVGDVRRFVLDDVLAALEHVDVGAKPPVAAIASAPVRLLTRGAR